MIHSQGQNRHKNIKIEKSVRGDSGAVQNSATPDEISLFRSNLKHHSLTKTQTQNKRGGGRKGRRKNRA